MNWNFTQLSELFASDDKSKLLLDGNWGLEKESQRVTVSGDLALTAHPPAFGDKLENSEITTDFSESQLELITPPFDSVEKTYEYLERLQNVAENQIGDELLWPLSMPPRLPDEDKIPIARFSNTAEGKEKEIYRTGLALRYGKKMQMISGIHYNFSLGDKMFDYLYEQTGKGVQKQTFKNMLYFALIRNYLRYRWLLIYLFGASPSAHPTFYSTLDKELEKISKCCPECCISEDRYEQYSTSLRVSRFGYSNATPDNYTGYYNSLEEYSHGIRKLMATKSEKFSMLGVFRNGQQLQLNDYILQKESEFYSSIRPKQIVRNGDSQLNSLKKNGVKYLEVRILDLNPFERTGISLNQLYFLQVFMLFCLFEQSKPLSHTELEKVNKNHHIVALSGRKPGLILYKYNNSKITIKKWSTDIFRKLRAIALMMDQGMGGHTYEACIEKEHKKIIDPSLLPSAQIYTETRKNNESYLDFGIRRAIINKQPKKILGGKTSDK
ncbi:MAG: glutamate--cysteine ligase [Clostridia bacterium]|nr:glutamate--cysteine ligase [Clostridia bacterium]